MEKAFYMRMKPQSGFLHETMVYSWLAFYVQIWDLNDTTLKVTKCVGLGNGETNLK